MKTIEAPALESTPFDFNALDQALDEAGIEVLVANSKHNVGWLMNGFRSSFFLYMEAIGLSRYLPLFVYQKGNPESVAYWGQHMEAFDQELGLIWVPRTNFEPHGSVDAMRSAVAYLRGLGAPPASIGVERSFMPADAEEVLRTQFPDARIVDAHFALESLRMIKTTAEIGLLRDASERIEAAMVASFAQARPGMTKHEFLKIIQTNEIQRDMAYDYAFVLIDQSGNPNPSSEPLTAGGKTLIDSGGNYRGYIGDICRPGCFGTPDEELVDLLAEVDAIQQVARGVVKAGLRGGDLVEVGLEAVKASSHRDHLSYIAHGMGLVAHERPQLATMNPHGYPPIDADRPLQSGMVLSVETFLTDSSRGVVGLEDTLVVTNDGYEALGDKHRNWNPMGVA
jgi:Xaa-Pro aminopeptidase